MNVKNINHYFVANEINRTADVQVWDESNSTTYLAAGELVITDAQGNVLNTASGPLNTLGKGLDQIFIVQRSKDGNSVYKSMPLPGRFITEFNIKNYTVGVEQITYLGYNGATGSLSATLAADTLYNIRIYSELRNELQDPVTKSFGWGSSSSTPVQADVVTGILKSFGLTNDVDLGISAKGEALCDHAGGAIAQTANYYKWFYSRNNERRNNFL